MNELHFLAPDAFPTDFYPFADTRNAEDLIWGGRTLGEQWKELLSGQIQPRLAVNPCWVPSEGAAERILSLAPGTGWSHSGERMAECASDEMPTIWHELPTVPDRILRPTDLFTRCAEAIEADWRRAAAAWGATVRTDWPAHVTVIGPPERLLAASTARALACSFNTEAGPIVLGPGVEIQEGAHLRGPLLIGAHTVVKMACRMAGPSAIGPECRLGGELSNVVIHGYTNKGHDGFLGNSVLGSWCNLGADTNCSNLKSNYSPVRLWNQATRAYDPTDLQFCGVLMGDHAKTSINTMFNTGTTVGAAVQVIGAGFPPKHIPAFSWGGPERFEPYDFDRFVATAEAVMARRNLKPSGLERQHLDRT